jgi:hypothetical protein
MIDVNLRRILSTVVGAAVCLSFGHPSAAAARSSLLEHFAATAVSANHEGAASRVDIYVERWSTEEEAARMQAALAHAPATLLPELQKVRRSAGVLLLPGVQGLGARARTRTPRTLRFARNIATPAGRQVVIASDQHLALGEAPREARARRTEFNLVDIRFLPDGTGIGKVALAGDLNVNRATGTIEMNDYEPADVRLIDVRSQPR